MRCLVTEGGLRRLAGMQSFFRVASGCSLFLRAGEKTGEKKDQIRAPTLPALSRFFIIIDGPQAHGHSFAVAARLGVGVVAGFSLSWVGRSLGGENC